MENKGGEDFFLSSSFSFSSVLYKYSNFIFLHPDHQQQRCQCAVAPPPQKKQNVSSVVQFNIFALSRSLSSVISSGQMGYLIPQALSQLDLVVPRGPQHNHSLSFPIPTVQEVTLLFPCIKITLAMHYLYV